MPKVFSVSSESKEFNVQPMLRQREKDIARTGSTNIEIPLKYVSSSELMKPDLLPVKELIEKEIKAQAELLHGLSIRIYHNTQLAHVKSKSNEYSFLASITMRKVKGVQQEYIEALFIMKALEAFQTHMFYGLVKAKTASRDLATIKGVHDKKNTPGNARRRGSSFTDEHLLKQLKKKEFFPILKTKSDGKVAIAYTDTPPFCNHAVALGRAKEIAAQGFSTLKLPSGYSKLTSHSPESVAALALTDMARKDQERALQRHVVKLQVQVDIAERFFISGHEPLAAKGMRKVKIVQQEYIHILRLLEAFQSYEQSLQYGLLNLDAVEDDLKAIKSVPCIPQPCKDSDDDLVTQLMDQKFFPMLFPLVGGGVRIHFSVHSPKEQSSRSSNKNNATSGGNNNGGDNNSPALPDINRRISMPPVQVSNQKGSKNELAVPQKGRSPVPYARRLSLRRST